MASRVTTSRRPAPRQAADGIARVLREAGRWDSVELDLVRMVTAALGLGVPFGWGLLSHHPVQGAAATIGALLVSGSGHLGSFAARILDVALGATVAAASLCLGVLLSRHWGGTELGIPLAAGILVLAGPGRPPLAKAGLQGVIALVLSPALAGPDVSIGTLGEWFLVGAAYAGLLTFAGHWTAGRITHLRDKSQTPPARPISALQRWDYPLNLMICLAIAELAAHIENKPHSTWIALTVAIVMQRDRATSLNRTVQRGLGTFLGAALGSLALISFSDGLLIAAVALIGAVRGHLKLANYTSYALVMTPLVMILLGAGHPTPGSLLRERVVDTAIGCAVALVVGQVLWPRISRRLLGARAV